MTTPEYFSPLNGAIPPEDVAPQLVEKFAELGYTSAGIAAHLGPDYTEALYRGEPAVVDVTAGDIVAGSTSPLDQVLRAFVLHDPVTMEELAHAVGARLAQRLVDAQVAVPATCGGGEFVIALDIRPHILRGQEYWVFSDVDASLVQHVPGPDHVLGVGAASLSLVHSTPSSPVGTVLDLGAGSGVQALSQLGCAESITATDIHPRALVLARASVAAAGAGASPRVELLQGPWFEPVRGRRFDRVVANPPFVVGLPQVGHVYRDSGLDLDGASQLVVSEVADYLNPGGSAHILAAWIHQGDVPWQQRVASWLPATGIRAWVIQRDVADPALYVSTWLKDESVDIRSKEGRAQAAAWMSHFRDNDVHGIGFGFVAITRIGDDEPSDVLAEEIPQAFTDPLGPEVEEYFARAAWLAQLLPGQLETTCFAPRPGLAKEDVRQIGNHTEPGDDPFAPAALRLTRTDGPRFSHDVDEHLAAIVAGLNPHGLNLEETVTLYALAHGLDEEALLASALPAITDLVRHGLVLPADLLEPGACVPGDKE